MKEFTHPYCLPARGSDQRCVRNYGRPTRAEDLSAETWSASIVARSLQWFTNRGMLRRYQERIPERHSIERAQTPEAADSVSMDLIHIRLLWDDWKCLLNRVPADSPIRHVFGPARSINYGQGVVTIDCSKEETERLLEVARQDCPGAVPAIQKAISENESHGSQD
jgi:hypothetical protein